MEMLLGNPLLMFGMIVLAFCAVGIGAWHFWGGALQNRLRGPDACPVLVIKKEPKLDDGKLQIDSGRYLVNSKTKRAWYLFPHAIQKAPDGSIAGVIIDNDSCIPQLPGMKQDIESLCQAVERNDPFMCNDRCLADIEKMHYESQNTALAEWLGFAALAAVGGILVVAIVTLLPSIKEMF